MALPPCRDQVLRITASDEEQITLLRVLGEQAELQVSCDGALSIPRCETQNLVTSGLPPSFGLIPHFPSHFG